MSNPDDYVVLHMLVNDGGGTTAYDAAKAHEYYLRTRVLKGRKAAVSTLPTSKTRGTPVSNVGTRSTARVAPKVVPKKTAAELAKEKQALKAHVVALQNRLAALKKVLAVLVKEAKARSGVKTKTAADNSPVTAAAKKTAAAKSSKTYYEKNKATILAKAKAEAAANSPTDLEAKIKEISDKIAKMRAELASKLKQ